MNLSSIDANNPSYLMVFQDGHDPWTFNLDQGNSVFVGSGSNCGIQLEGDGIFQIHCMAARNGDTVLVQDWNTGATFVNGQKVDGELAAKSGDQIQIGECQLIPVLDRQFHLGIATELLENPPKVGGLPTQIEKPAVKNDSTVSPKAENPSTRFSFGDEDEFSDEKLAELIAKTKGSLPLEAKALEMATTSRTENLDQITTLKPMDATIQEEAATPVTLVRRSETDPTGKNNDETACCEPPVEEQSNPANIKNDGEKFVYDIDADLEAEDDEAGFDFEPETLSTIVGSEDSEDDRELLQMEVEQLRFELAERDARIRDLNQKVNSGPSNEFDDEEQTLKLVERLEELLAELQTSDDRIKALEELLRLSDQATVAEKEERQQLESWVTEIEKRLSEREEENAAEVERLTRRLRDSRQHVKQAQSQLDKLLQAQNQSESSVSTEEAADLIQECQIQIKSLRDQLEAVQKENENLRARPMVNQETQDACEELQLLKDKLAKLEVESSREKAELARKHAEIERLHDELEEKLMSAKKFSTGDTRIQAMRQHLREIHEEEKTEKEERWKNSLGGRIVRLLNRSK